MNNFTNFFKKNHNVLIKIIVLIGIISIIIQTLPDLTSFNYKYEVGKIWNYSTLEAPFNFPIYKTSDQIAKEKFELTKEIKPYFIYDATLTEEKIQSFRKSLYSIQFNDNHKLIEIDSLFTNIMHTGIIKANNYIDLNDSSFIICIESGKYARYVFLDKLYTTESAEKTIQNHTSSLLPETISEINKVVNDNIADNVFFDKNKTDEVLKERNENYSNTLGMIKKGTIIVSENDIVTKDISNKLNSLKTYTENNTRSTSTLKSRSYTFILYTFIVLCFYFFLYIYKPNYVLSNRSFILITLIIGIIVLTSYIIEKNYIKYILIIPIFIVPIIFRAFFDYRTALWGLIFTVLLVAMTLPDGFYYSLTNITTGLIVISCLSRLEKRSQYFLIIFAILICYEFFYLINELISNNTLLYIDVNNIIYYCINACLTLIAFPLIFYIEKISGMTTDISLIEYANTNNKLLRELSTIAPGTFHHCIQVANLAENAARKIGANVLLTRVGSLYHDIGKMYKPDYFSENQIKNSNPHDTLPPQESANIIISHVIKGIELATKYHLPENIKDFIRTHHGTRLTSFFYAKAVDQNGVNNVNKNNFQYHGPKPFSRETAIVMMADSIEAVSKSITTPDEQSIINLVNNVIDKQIKEGQFNNSNITFKEIEEIKKVFIASLKTTFHLRVKYPS